MIGTKQEEGRFFKENVQKISNNAIEICQKLYVGEDAQWLVGEKKIPEYLNIYLKGVEKQAEQFRIDSIRYLREAALEYISLCEKIPATVFSFLEDKYTNIIINAVNRIENEYTSYEKHDKALRQEHLKQFRPNLANPANEEELKELDKQAKERTDKFLEKVDDTQMELLDFEMDKSNEFYVAYLNNLRTLLRLYE